MLSCGVEGSHQNLSPTVPAQTQPTAALMNDIDSPRAVTPPATRTYTSPVATSSVGAAFRIWLRRVVVSRSISARRLSISLIRCRSRIVLDALGASRLYSELGEAGSQNFERVCLQLEVDSVLAALAAAPGTDRPSHFTLTAASLLANEGKRGAMIQGTAHAPLKTHVHAILHELVRGAGDGRGVGRRCGRLPARGRNEEQPCHAWQQRAVHDARRWAADGGGVHEVHWLRWSM